MNVGAQSSYSDLSGMTNPPASVAGSGITPPALVIPTSGVDFYTDAAMLSAACPTSTAFTTEMWASTIVAPNSVITCSDIISSTTNDACFTAGSVVPGFELTSDGAGGPPIDQVILTTGFLGVTSDVVGPNTFADNAIINFTVPTNLASFEFVTPFNVGEDFTVEVFGASGSLGTTTVTSDGLTPVFFGALASEDITSITMTSVNADIGELFSAISFDLCTESAEAVPTMGEWGVICLSLGLLIFSVVAFKERETVIA